MIGVYNVLVLASKLAKGYPSDNPREIFISIMYNTAKFCEKLDFDIERTGAVLSIFYLTHIFTTSRYDLSSEMVYSYFKELLFCHTLPFPPTKQKIFTQKEAKSITEYFYKIYLRNLPLVRFLVLPNFALTVCFEKQDRVDADVGKAETKVDTKNNKSEKKSKSKTPNKKRGK